LTDEGIAHFSNLSKLQKLHLSCDCRGQGFTGWCALAELESLELVSCRSLKDLGIEHICSILNMKELYLNQLDRECEFSDAAFRGLHKLQQLETLCLPYSLWEEETGKHVSQCKSLKILDVCCGDSSFRHITSMTQCCPCQFDRFVHQRRPARVLWAPLP